MSLLLWTGRAFSGGSLPSRVACALPYSVRHLLLRGKLPRDPCEMETSPAFSLALPVLKLFMGSLFLAHKINSKLTCKGRSSFCLQVHLSVSCLTPNAAFASLHPAAACLWLCWDCSLRLKCSSPVTSVANSCSPGKAWWRHSLPPKAQGSRLYQGPGCTESWWSVSLPRPRLLRAGITESLFSFLLSSRTQYRLPCDEVGDGA